MGSPLRPTPRSPTLVLLAGLIVTLVAVVADGWYITRQMEGLRTLQTDLADRDRRDSLQLLRIQNALNTVALAMRDMLDDEQYPLTAWRAQFDAGVDLINTDNHAGLREFLTGKMAVGK